MSFDPQIIGEAVRQQRVASNPEASAWASANAGSGKTRVLIDRVIRLLLDGAQPSTILCVTFTKAAAAEMEQRLFKTLGAWSLKDDASLRAAISELSGAEASVDDEALDAARRLFAQSLETPGGLKIQTIHAFCESVLKRFPIEAGLKPGFEVAGDEDAAALRDAALADVAMGRASGSAKAAFDRLAAEKPEGAVRSLLADLSRAEAEVLTEMREVGGEEAYFRKLADIFGIDPEAEFDRLQSDYLASLDGGQLSAAIGALETGGKTDIDRAAELRAADRAKTGEKIHELSKALLTKDLTPRADSRFPTKAIKTGFPDATAWLYAEQRRLRAYLEARAAKASFDLSVDLHRVAGAVGERYRSRKALVGLLDYDDLISKTRALFSGAAAAWALYKLDRGIDHILLDEAQDTSPGQWSVLDGLIAEFFAGEGAASEEGRKRTMFVVGDEKQSIYSFQGADIGLFVTKQSDLHERVTAADRMFEAPTMAASFRTTPPVLGFVDALFKGDAAEGVTGAEAMPHLPARAGGAGRVELWPLIAKEKAEETKPWDAPLDAETASDPAAVLANRIAATVDGWIASSEHLASRGRPILPSDIMVLVTRRGAIYRAISRALIARGVPVEGADRIQVLDDAGVQDLLSLARWALQRSDDLSLAELLRSPFGGLSEDELFAIAHPREGQLQVALRLAAEAGVAAAEAHERLQALVRGAERLSPFDFFSRALDAGAPSGRSLLSSRLGSEWEAPVGALLDLALDYEREPSPSLGGFLRWVPKRAKELKRELDEGSGGVRVMTVHGAKGLESEIVFLADANDMPQAPKSDRPYALVAPPSAPGGAARPLPGMFAVDAGLKPKPAAIEEAKADAVRRQMEERRRLLYVAATRARERLYICGVEGQRKDTTSKDLNERSWHGLATLTFRELAQEGAARVEDREDGLTYVLEAPQTAEPDTDDETTSTRTPPLPEWASRPAPIEAAPARLAPSRLGGEEAEAMQAEEAAAYSPLAADPLLRGKAIHALLEHLPGAAPEERRVLADAYLAASAPGVGAAERAIWRDEALGVLDDPAFAAVFAAGSLAEVPISGRLSPAGPLITGQIDRLAVTEAHVLCVDYKTNRPPPDRWEAAPAAYIAQLAAYRALLQRIFPGRTVRAALLWTYAGTLMEVPADALETALAKALGAHHASETA